MEHALDNVVWHALNGPHRRLAEGSGAAVRYRSSVSPFGALPDDPNPEAWADFAALVGPAGIGVLFRDDVVAPPGWTELERLPTRQMVAEHLAGERWPEAVPLGADDVDGMLALVERTQPGPFGRRTIELGSYVGVRRDGELVAMAGERMRTDGWTEISAVCTDDAVRGQGLAAALVLHLVAGIREAGRVPFLHVLVTNTNAARLYEHLGFADRREVVASILQAPD